MATIGEINENIWVDDLASNVSLCGLIVEGECVDIRRVVNAVEDAIDAVVEGKPVILANAARVWNVAFENFF